MSISPSPLLRHALMRAYVVWSLLVFWPFELPGLYVVCLFLGMEHSEANHAKRNDASVPLGCVHCALEAIVFRTFYCISLKVAA